MSKYLKFNLSLDDLSPHPRAGLNFESIKWCDKLIEDYPDLRINLFVPAAFCRLGEDPHKLSDNPDWVKKLRALPSRNYCINLHGLHHRRLSVKHGHSNNDEWEHLTFSAANILAGYMLREFQAVELTKYGYAGGLSSHKRIGDPKFKYTFRPPGWKISKESVQALQNHGVTCFAGSKKYYRKTKDVLKPGTSWVSYNWDLTGPCEVMHDDIVSVSHTSDWTNNYMNEERYNLIKDFLDAHKEDQFRFMWIEEF